MKLNYQKELDMIVNHLQNEGKVPRLLLHSCCAPCSSYPIEYLSRYFAVTIFYYNPNITTQSEYDLRLEEQKRLISEMECVNDVQFMEGGYNSQLFYDAVSGLENIKEGGERCFSCFKLRLEETARVAHIQQFDYFATTLTISPLKNADKLNEIGKQVALEHMSKYLSTDFKKKGGFQRSIQLSSEFNLYRQEYCGCIFSKIEAEKRLTEIANAGNED